MKDQYVTVVYRIVDEAEWIKTNPCKYVHNGLNPYFISLGDMSARRDALLEALEEIIEHGDGTSRNIAKRAVYDNPEMTQ